MWENWDKLSTFVTCNIDTCKNITSGFPNSCKGFQLPSPCCAEHTGPESQKTCSLCPGTFCSRNSGSKRNTSLQKKVLGPGWAIQDQATFIKLKNASRHKFSEVACKHNIQYIYHAVHMNMLYINNAHTSMYCKYTNNKSSPTALDIFLWWVLTSVCEHLR